jgi:hypothetical protein
MVGEWRQAVISLPHHSPEADGHIVMALHSDEFDPVSVFHVFAPDDDFTASSKHGNG